METFEYRYKDLFNPVLTALHQLGGSGTNDEIEEKVISILGLSNSEIEDIHRGNQTKLTYRLAWARNYLKRFGLIENSGRALWSLTPSGLATDKVDKDEVMKAIRDLDSSDVYNLAGEVSKIEIPEIRELDWEDELIEILKEMEPSAFERLSQRLLRELGFTSVEVTGKSGDGGIDGVGVIKIGGVLSFHVVFQSKRYNGSVSSNLIRDFRGAMIGRADKGVFITTGNFTRDAKLEAQRDGAPPIDLIDGHDLAGLLKDLRLGVGVEMREFVTIDTSWFTDV